MRALVHAVALGVLLAACDSPSGSERRPPTPPRIVQVGVSPASPEIFPDDSLQLVAVALDSLSRNVQATFTWSSSDPSVATVDQSGKVRAVAPGSAKIRATTAGVTGEAALTVHPVAVRIAYRYPSVFAGDTTLLRAAVTAPSGAAIEGRRAAWTSLDPAVAQVTPEGVATGAAAGVARLVAQSGAAADTVALAVIARRSRSNREIAYLRPVQLAFTSYELWTMQADGSGARRVSVPGEYVAGYAWSPEGDRLLISYAAMNGVGRAGTWVADADGSGETSLGRWLGWTPRWSPDGSRILFVDYQDIYTVSSTGADVRKLTTQPGWNEFPAWSPDGRQVLFTRNRTEESAELWVMAADGSGQRRVPLPVVAFQAQWSPDGKHLLFHTRSQIWVANADGSDAHGVSPLCPVSAGCRLSYPVWSPDGKKIAYFRADTERWLVIADRDGSNEVRVKAANCCAFDDAKPSWSPDGTRLVFESHRPEPPTFLAVTIVGVDGTGRASLTGGADVHLPRWRP